MIISSDGLCVRIPSMASGAERRRGPRISAPKSLSRLNKSIPTIPVINRPMFSIIGSSVIGAPRGLSSSSPKNCVSTMGAMVIRISERVAWTSDNVLGLPPASIPNTTMSCKPPGIDE